MREDGVSPAASSRGALAGPRRPGRPARARPAGGRSGSANSREGGGARKPREGLRAARTAARSATPRSSPHIRPRSPPRQPALHAGRGQVRQIGVVVDEGALEADVADHRDTKPHTTIPGATVAMSAVAVTASAVKP